MRRTVLAALALAVAVPAGAVAKPLPPCVTFGDAKADSGPNGVTQLDDPALDLTRVRLSATGVAWVAQLTVAGYAERPVAAAGGRYEVAFTVGRSDVVVWWKNGPARDEESVAYVQQGIYVDGAMRHDAVEGRVDGNVVTLSVKLNMLGSALGFRADGIRATGVRVASFGSYAGAKTEWDAATGPASGFVVAARCR